MAKLKCEIALYLGKKKEKNLKGYTTSILLYCSECKYYFIKHDEMARLNELSEYRISTKTYDEFTEVRKKSLQSKPSKSKAKKSYPPKEIQKGSPPIVISNNTSCTICKKTPLLMSFYELWICLKSTPDVKNGYVNILAPYCNKCKGHVISKYDKLKINDLSYRYVRLPQQPEIPYDELVMLVHKHLNISPLEVSTQKSVKSVTAQKKNDFCKLTNPTNKKYRTSSIISLIAEVYIDSLFKIIEHTYYAIVSDGQEENIENNILFSENPFVKEILRAIAFEKDSFMYEEIKYIIKWHSDSDYIKQTKILRVINIYFGEPCCTWNGHGYKSITANILCEDSNVAKVNVLYCEDCDKYLMDIESYRTYQQKYRNIIIQLSFDREISYDNRYGYYLDYGKKESLLFILGYSTTLAEQTRHSRLVSIITCRQMEKAKVINHLSFLIRRNGNNPKHFHSIPKWKSDLEFVNDYEINKQEEIYAKIIINARKLGF